MILKKHKNTLLDTIRESGFDPRLFSPEDGVISKEKFFIIRLRESTLRFAVRPFAEFDMFQYYCSTFTPGFPLTGPYGYYDTKSLHIKFTEWLNSVVRPYLDESITPDLWQTLEDTYSEAKRKLGTPDDFKQFSEEEKLQLKRSIDGLRLSIENNFNLQEKELAATNKLLQHLSDAIDKHSKFDWRGIAINVAVTIAIHLALNPEQSRQLFQLFRDAFSNITYLLP